MDGKSTNKCTRVLQFIVYAGHFTRFGLNPDSLRSSPIIPRRNPTFFIIAGLLSLAREFDVIEHWDCNVQRGNGENHFLEMPPRRFDFDSPVNRKDNQLISPFQCVKLDASYNGHLQKLCCLHASANFAPHRHRNTDQPAHVRNIIIFYASFDTFGWGGAEISSSALCFVADWTGLD